jgi:uncharacterized membrane protein YsdA (DUF1294 family)
MLGVFAIIAAMNIATFVAFGFDKQQARNKRWRVSERNLLLMAALGGWVGAKSGQVFFRHKTFKTPFKTQLNAIPLLYVIAGGIIMASYVFELF